MENPVRIALVILIAVVQVAGPWLCCCGPVRLAAGIAGKPEPKSVAAAPVKKATSYDCPHCKKLESLATPVPTDATPVSSPDQCPCGGVELVAVPAEPPVEVAVPFAVAVEPFGFGAFSAPVVSLAVASVPGLRELPNLTAHDRLFKHHVLRC